MPMMTFNGVRNSWLIDFRNSGLSTSSIWSAKKTSWAFACVRGTLTGFTTSYSQHESFKGLRGCETSYVDLIQLVCLRALCEISSDSRNQPSRPTAKAPSFCHKFDRRRAIPVQI